MTFKIESGIPISPPARRGASYPFSVMEIGQSFAVPRENGPRMRNAAAQASMRTPRRFVVRASATEFRCWRIE